MLPQVASKQALQVMFAILATGAILNLANKGTFGTQVQKISRYVTSGYGAGAL